MEWILANWMQLVAVLAVTGMCIFVVVDVSRQPREQQVEAVKAWLLWAVNKAEDELGGGGTGPMKLRMVYDLFCTRFPWVARLVSFDTFSDWVVDALKELDNYLSTKSKLDGDSE